MPEEIPAKDWCQEAVDLRQLKRDLVAGDAVSETRFGDRMVRFVKADLTRLDEMIREADRECAVQSGEKPPRRRFALGVRVRPY